MFCTAISNLFRYTNSAHQRYWRVLKFKFMWRPIAFLGTSVVTYIFFAANELFAVNINKAPGTFAWDDAVADVLEQMTLRVSFCFLEKLFISYIAVHYHYRGDNVKIPRIKDLQNALIALYDASVFPHPPHREPFAEEDLLIRNAKEASTTQAVSGSLANYLARLGIDGYKMTSLFGSFISAEPNAHWLRPASTYAVTERALGAADIWLSFAAEGKPGRAVDDIIEVLGPYRKSEPVAIFKTLNDNNSPDIRVEEFVGIVTEGGRTRHQVYKNMENMDHCINTFDWFCLLTLASVMISFVSKPGRCVFYYRETEG
ncbi:hypothetical protein CSHISOI_10128 [Colletotrichum shisoi]|uniref:Uncharacterized protein n=1 Tax=Colletotrichum shisoi TaxID=2078593 RepID=A0A5Q4BF49_9PEZI|nr:hypothetical protein CSHISOI_10128 [Colletotrichum shisoi]